MYGLYARFGQATPRGVPGFIVYRPDHWLLEGTHLRYGDVLGADDGIVGYETVGTRVAFTRYRNFLTEGDTSPSVWVVDARPGPTFGEAQPVALPERRRLDMQEWPGDVQKIVFAAGRRGAQRAAQNRLDK